MIFVGPTMLSGIGQVLNKYRNLLGGTYYDFNDPSKIPKDQDVFMFLLPIKNFLECVPRIKSISKRVLCMTVCETETVHEDYEKVFKLFDVIMTPSEFCKTIFERQFPGVTKFVVVRHFVPVPRLIKTQDRPTYIFYHIGNITDPRKNIAKLVEAFMFLDLPYARLFLKATCVNHVDLNVKNVFIVNGVLPDDQMEKIHNGCDCYVSFSSSEGAGMGAVEAAMYDKPVIITDYGAPTEYIKTPYTIKCGMRPIPEDDFLFKKGMLWGDPDYNQLLEFMQDAYDKKLRFMDHSHTKSIVSSENIKNQISSLLV